MKKYVVIDTNVLVSALITRNENAPTVKILKYFSQNKIVPVYASEIVKEYYEVLRREKFKLSEEIVSALIKDIVNNGLRSKKYCWSQGRNAGSERCNILCSYIGNKR